MSDPKSRAVARPKRSIFAPLALLAAALLGSLLSDIVQEFRQHEILVERNAQLNVSMTDSHKVRDQFGELVKGISKLAEADNHNAAAILNSLQQAGVNLNPSESEKY